MWCGVVVWCGDVVWCGVVWCGDNEKGECDVMGQIVWNKRRHFNASIHQASGVSHSSFFHCLNTASNQSLPN